MKSNQYSEAIAKSKYLHQIKNLVSRNKHIGTNGHYDIFFKELIYHARKEGYSLALISEISGAAIASVINWSKQKPIISPNSVRELEIIDNSMVPVRESLENMATNSKPITNEKYRFRLKIANLLEFEVISATKFLDIKFSKTGE